MNITDKKYKQHLAIWIIVTVILVAGAYYAGMKHETSKLKSSFGRGATALGGARTGGAGASRFGSGAGLVTGTVISKDADSMTVQAKDGSSKIIIYSGSTQVLESTSGTADDVSVGSNVSAQGTQNSDGSVTATSIQIRPAASTSTPPQTPANPVQ